jgi:HSP20 family protein
MALPVKKAEEQRNRWDPFGELDRLNSQFRHLLGEWSGVDPMEGFTPPAEIEETEDAWLVDVEVPGVDREDIDIEVAGRRLSIKGERREKERAGVLRQRTRTVGRFQFEALLPGVIAEDGIEASLDGGVLHVRVPKSEEARPRRIEIS